MKNYLLLNLLLFVTLYAHAQKPTFKWANMNGGTNAYSFNQSFAVDSKGNIFAVGVCTDTSYFTTKKGSNIFINGIDSNFYLAKYNANGDFLWAKNMHGNLNRKGNTIAIDEHDNIYIVGYYINLGIKHDYILKLDSNINYVWQKPCNDATLAVSVDAKGNVYCVGNLIYKFDPMGNIIYWKVLTSTAALGNSVSQDKWGNCFITGSINYRDIFISKLDTAGSLQWTKIFIDSLSKFNSQSGNSIKLDNLGNSYTTGTFDGVIDFDPSVNNYTLRSGANSCCPSMFILKLDSAGNFVWAKMFEKSSNDYGYSIAIDSTFNIYATGTFSGNVDADPGVGQFILKNYGIYILKWDSSGKFIWATKIGKSLISDKGTQIEVDKFNNVYVSGEFWSTSDFDPGRLSYLMTSGGKTSDGFLLKLGQAVCSGATSGYDTVSSCGDYNFNGKTISASGQYFDTIYNYLGCDSAITLNLTVLPFDRGVMISDTLLMSYAVGAVYQWVTCPNYTIISGATNQTFVPTVSGEYALILSYNGCIDTIGCYNIIYSGIEQISLKNKMSISPNPANDKIVVSSQKEITNATIKITNATGMVVIQKNHVSGKSIDMNINELSKGIYYVQIVNANNVQVIKLLKE